MSGEIDLTPRPPTPSGTSTRRLKGAGGEGKPMKRIKLWKSLFSAGTMVGLASSISFADTLTTPMRMFGSPRVTCVALSPDGRTSATSADDAAVKIWDGASWQCLRVLTGHTGRVRCVVFSFDGKRLLTGADDSTARLWDVGSGTCLKTFARHRARVSCVAFSKDGSRIVTGSNDRSARLWDAGSGASVTAFSGSQMSYVSVVALSPDEKQVITGSDEGGIRFWDAATGEIARMLSGHQSKMLTIRFVNEGARLVSQALYDGTEAGSIKLWDIATGTTLKSYAVRFSSTGTDFGSLSADGLTALANMPENTNILALWDIASGDTIRTLRGHSMGVTAARFSENGLYVISGSGDGVAKVWEASTGKCLRTYWEHKNRIVSVAFSPDGAKVLTGSWDSTAMIWDAATGRSIQRLSTSGSLGRVHSAAFSPDAARIVVASNNNTLTIWNAASGALVRTNVQFKDPNLWVSFSADGKKILATGFAEAFAWDPVTQDMLVTKFPAAAIAAPKVTPDGSRVLIESGKVISLYAAASGDYVRTLAGHTSEVTCLDFSSDGSQCVSGSLDKTVKLWDAATGECLRTFSGHSGEIVSCALSPDGTLMLSCAADNSARLWEVATGKRLRTYDMDDPLAGVFSPDGTKVLVGCMDAAARLWPTPLWSSPALPGKAAPAKPERTPIRVVKATGNRIVLSVPGGALLHGATVVVYGLDGRIAAQAPVGRECIDGMKAVCRLPRRLNAGMYLYRVSGLRCGAKPESANVIYIF